MSNSFKGLVVTFKNDIHEDYVKKIIAAISIIDGVCEVTGEIANFDDHMNRTQVTHEIKIKLLEVISEL